MQNNESNPEPKENSKKPWLFIFFLLLMLAMTASSIWITTTSTGLRFLLSMVSRVSGERIIFEDVNGTLRALSIKKISYTSDDLRSTIDDIELRWQPQLLFSRQLSIDMLTVKTIETQSSPSPKPDKKPFVLPENLRLPLSITLQKLEIGVLQMLTIGKEAPDFTITNITASVESDAQRHSLREISLDSEFGKLSGSIQMNPDKPFDLSAHATLLSWLPSTQIDAAETAISIELTGNLKEIKGTVTGKSVNAQGKGDFVLHPFATMPLATLHLTIDKMDPSAFLADMPKANLSIHTDLIEDSAGKLQGNMVIKNSLPLPLDQNGLPMIEVRARSSISMDEIQFDDILLKMTSNASITGHFDWQIARAMGTADLKVNQLNPAALDTRLQVAKINGYLKLTGDTAMQQGTISLQDKAKALSLETNLTRTETAVSLEKFTLRHHNSILTGQGQLDLKESQSFHFEGMLGQFNLASFMQAPPSNLNATFELSGKLAPQISGVVNFTVMKSQFAKQPVIGKGQLTFDDTKRIKSEVNLQVGSNQLSTKGAFGNKGDRLLLNIAAPALAQLGIGLEGNLNAQITLADTLDSPRLLVESSAKRLMIDNRHQLSEFTITGNLHETAVALDIKAANYRLDTEDYLKNLAITLAGNKARHTLSIETGLPKDSHLVFQTTGKLALPTENPQNFQWNGELEKLSATGLLPVHFLNQPTLSISQKRITLGPTRISVAEGEINMLDTHWTPQQWSTRGTLAAITLKPENALLQSGEALQLGGEWDITASKQLRGHLRIARERGDWAFLLEDSPFQLGLQQLQFDARAQDGGLAAGLVIRGERIGETIANGTLPLTYKNGVWQIAHDLPLSGKMNVNIADLSWIGPVVDSNLKNSGQLSLEANVAGTFNQPRLNGTILGKELAIALLDEGIHLQQGSLKAQFDQTALQISTLTFVSPHQPPPSDRILSKIKLPKESGQLTVAGAIDYQDQRSHLTIQIDHLPLAQQPDRWIIASGSGKVSLNKQQLTIDGKLATDAGFLLQPETGRPQLSDDVVIIGQPPLPANSQKLLVNLDATLDLGEHFYLRASGLEGRLAGQLHLSSKPGQALHAIGTITARDTLFNAYGQHLTVQRGIVSFDGPLDDPALNILAVRKDLPVNAGASTYYDRRLGGGQQSAASFNDPRLNALATSRDLAVEAGVQVTGTVRHPIIKLVSTPNVPDSEKLSWIVLGRPPDASGMDTSLLLAAAGSILGGQSGGGVIDQIGQALGVDEFSIRQQTTGSTSGSALSSQIGVIGKRLSSHAYLSYERGLTTAAAGITKLTYSLTRNITIVTRAGDDNAIDLYYTFQYD
ncbi:translocation/assembly module TamB domain-containing protein [Nitrosomonas sp. Nm33]|uniref:translocation/assembly module TamB domain-containing protein n=1 Tax=Nitrosomonas sp. Nm33 TaxID=133724 RepID=UPI0008961486|nr:translocation/assembly module TamB domain-containing protein [Nitrosomonas sp. Nm33]SDX86826.1 translocation and assembly module TamB [Nitrosomonas sp. Nm33]